MKYDSLILDIDGTLWDTTLIVAQAWNEMIVKFFPSVKPVTADVLKTQFGKTMDVIADNLFGGLSNQQKSFLIEKCCENEQKLLELNVIDLSYKGVSDTVALLGEKVPIFIVSNCQSGYIQLVCSKMNIGPYIKDFICFGDNGFSKDKNIRLICDRNLLQNPVYVGDTQGDYDACIVAGVDFIHASYGFGKNLVGSFESIQNFAELVRFF